MSWQELRPFVLSLRRTEFDGEVVLFAAGIDRDSRRLLASSGIGLRALRRAKVSLGERTLEPYDPVFDRLHPHYPTVIRQTSRLFRDPQEAAKRMAALVSVRDTRRFFAYLDYLSKRETSYGNVMLTDVRDVFFQADPFAFDLGGELRCFLEDSGETLGTQPHNRKWLQTAFGDDVLAELGGKPIVCAGVTIGPLPLVLGYLRVMASFLLRLPHQAVGLDQAVHNYVLHKGLVPCARLVPNGEGSVSTLGIVPEAHVPELLSSAVLHQYDRHPAVAETLLERLQADDADPFLRSTAEASSGRGPMAPFNRARRSIHLRRRRLVEAPSISISEYVAAFPAHWQVTHESAPLTWPLPRRIGSRQLRAAFDLPRESAELGVLTIEDGRVFGAHGWVLGANGAVLTELSWYEGPNERIVLPASLPRPRRVNGTCLSLVSDWSSRNYAHFLLDALGRLAVLDEAGISLSEFDRIYCPTPPSPAAAGLLDRFGIPPEKRIFAAPELLLSAERLLVPSRPATALTFPALLPAFLRRAVHARSTASPERRLYVSRRGFERRASSEPELERVVRERGFEVYEAGAQPTQPEDFDEATFVVGAHGAGLANLAFCKPGTRVLEIVPTDNAHPFYYSLAVGAGLDYAYVVGQSVVDRPLDVFGPSPYDFELDAEELEAALDGWDTSQTPVRP